MKKDLKYEGNMHDKKVYIVLPAYNEASTIADVIQKLKNSGHTNIIVVNDGSNDDTKSILKTLDIYYVNHEINR